MNKLGGKEFVLINRRKVDRNINGALDILFRAAGNTSYFNGDVQNCTVNKS